MQEYRPAARCLRRWSTVRQSEDVQPDVAPYRSPRNPWVSIAMLVGPGAFSLGLIGAVHGVALVLGVFGVFAFGQLWCSRFVYRFEITSQGLSISSGVFGVLHRDVVGRTLIEVGRRDVRFRCHDHRVLWWRYLVYRFDPFVPTGRVVDQLEERGLGPEPTVLS